MEFFSPPRVAIPLRSRGYNARYSFDILTGYDFLQFEDRARALRLVETHEPFFLMLSPPCTMFSSMQNLNFGKMDKEVKAKRFEEAKCLLDFSMMLAQKQISANRFFCHEHPYTSWRRASVRALASRPDVQTVSFDQCRVGLQTPVSQEPLRKRTTLMTNSQLLAQRFATLQCQCAKPHAVIQGSQGGLSISTYCQIYTPELVNQLVESVIDTWQALHPPGP